MSAGNSKEVEVWEKVMKGALSLPGAKINREAYLQKELSKHYTQDIVRFAIATTPAKAGVSASKINTISKSSIAWHRAGVTTASFATGIPGGWWIAGTMPADLTQFFWHVSVILQKLAYLHGWPELFVEEGGGAK